MYFLSDIYLWNEIKKMSNAPKFLELEESAAQNKKEAFFAKIILEYCFLLYHLTIIPSSWTKIYCNAISGAAHLWHALIWNIHVFIQQKCWNSPRSKWKTPNERGLLCIYFNIISSLPFPGVLLLGMPADVVLTLLSPHALDPLCKKMNDSRWDSRLLLKLPLKSTTLTTAGSWSVAPGSLLGSRLWRKCVD